MMFNSHLTDEQLLTASYHDEPPPHLERCADCQARLHLLNDLLDLLRDHPVPERTTSYGFNVWARLQPQLPQMVRPWRRALWLTVPTAAFVLIIVISGMLTHRQRPAQLDPAIGDRVLLTAVSDHFDRAQLLLTDLVHASSGVSIVAEQQQNARELLNENRLLRQLIAQHHCPAQAAVLGELERTLLDVANSPATPNSPYMTSIREQVEANSLLFKVRVVTYNLKRKGQPL